MHKAVTFCFHCALSLATTLTMFQPFHPACRLQVFLGLLTALLPSGLHPNATVLDLPPRSIRPTQVQRRLLISSPILFICFISMRIEAFRLCNSCIVTAHKRNDIQGQGPSNRGLSLFSYFFYVYRPSKPSWLPLWSPKWSGYWRTVVRARFVAGCFLFLLCRGFVLNSVQSFIISVSTVSDVKVIMPRQWTLATTSVCFLLYTTWNFQYKRIERNGLGNDKCDNFG